MSSFLRMNFEDVFPLPKFLEIPSIGVDISDASVKYLELVQKNNRYEIDVFGDVKLNEGAVINGEIKDRKVLVEALKTLRRKTGIQYANVSLPEEKAFLFKVVVPAADDDAIRTNLSFQLEKKVPVALSEAVFDYDLLASTKGQKNEAVVTVFPAEFVQSYLNAFKEAGITPLSMEIEAQAIARAVVPSDTKETSMVVDFGQKRTGLSVVSRGAVVYTSTLDVGGFSMTEKIKQILKISDEEAVKFKNEIGFSLKSDPAVYDAISATVIPLRDEINKHYNYWNSRAEEGGESAIDKIYLCGGNSNIAGVREYLAESLNITVMKGNVWTNLFSFDEYIPPIDDKKASSFATSVGLALANSK